MNTEYIDLIEETPKIDNKKCKILSYILKSILTFTTYFSALLALYLYDYFIAGAIFLLSFIIMGIVRSKISNAVIPSKQREFQYSDQEIADWYIAREVCFEEEILED